MTGLNPFEAYDEAVKPGWARTRERSSAKAAATRARTKAEKQLDEDEMLESLWAKGETQRRRDLLAGPHGKDIKGLMAFVKSMTMSSAPALIRLIETATWIQTMDQDDRRQVLRIVDQGIGRLFKAEGLPYPDDALWDEPPRAYAVIRDIMGVR